MHEDTFAVLARRLGSRRSTLRSLFGGGCAALVAWLGPPGRVESRRGKKRRKKPHKKRRRCQPETPAATCAGRCGAERTNNCGQAVACFCPDGPECLANGSCATPCFGRADCPQPCFCANEPGESSYCTQHAACQDVTQGCSTSAECPPGEHCAPSSCFGFIASRCQPLCEV